MEQSLIYIFLIYISSKLEKFYATNLENMDRF